MKYHNRGEAAALVLSGYLGALMGKRHSHGWLGGFGEATS